MNNTELTGKVHSAVYHQCQRRGYAAPVDVLMDIGVLSKADYENWRRGKVPYLEKVCRTNLHKLSFIMKQIRVYARKSGYKESFTVYKRWGKGKKSPLYFSKTRNPNIERNYATHYVDAERIAELKKTESENE